MVPCARKVANLKLSATRRTCCNIWLEPTAEYSKQHGQVSCVDIDFRPPSFTLQCIAGLLGCDDVTARDDEVNLQQKLVLIKPQSDAYGC